jgi:hypothetical protein
VKLEWKFIHENFLPYQTLSDLGAPKTISNHFRLFKIHEKIAFLAKVGNFSPTLANKNRCWEKLFCCFVFGRMNGRMADGSFKI